jgi:hypothetical protein
MTNERQDPHFLRQELVGAIRENARAGRPAIEEAIRDVLGSTLDGENRGSLLNQNIEAQRLGHHRLSANSEGRMRVEGTRRTSEQWQAVFSAAEQSLRGTLPETQMESIRGAFENVSRQLTCDTLHEVAGSQRPNGRAPNLPEFQRGGSCNER